MTKKTSRREFQRGSILIISLIFLLLLTILGLTAMQGTTLEEKMAGNTRDSSLALQAAEAALREAEDYLDNAVLGDFAGVGGRYQPASPGSPQVWENSGTNWQVWAGDIPGVSSQPEYIIEELEPYPDPEGSLAADEPPPQIRVYRVTARGYGANPNTQVTLQTTYRRE